MKLYDVVIIGGGPAGLTATLCIARAGLSLALVEMRAPGGQMLKTSIIENYPGFPKGVGGRELAEIFAAHLQSYTFARYNEEVTNFESLGSESILTIGEEKVRARTVIICSGVSPRPLGLFDEKRLVGRGISYCALCDGSLFQNQVVAIVGGGDTALEEALYLSKIVKKIYLIHWRDVYRASQIYQNKVKACANIEAMLNTTITALHGADILESIDVKNINTGLTAHYNVTGLFVFVGHVPYRLSVPEEIKVDEMGYILTDQEMRTSLPGVFAAGDIRSKLCKQVATAVGDGTSAAHSALLYLDKIGA